MTEERAIADRVAVLVPAPLAGPLDYAVPEGLGLAPGELVEVELGARVLTGVVWGPGDQALALDRLKPVVRRLPVPGLGAALREFIAKAAAYTMTPPGMMLRLATRAPDLGRPPKPRLLWRLAGPPPGRLTEPRARVIAVLEEAGAPMAASVLAERAGVSQAVIRGLAKAGALAPVEAPEEAPPPPLFGQPPGQHLSPAQAEAAADLRAAVAAGKFDAVLLKGVTGSGKTEVYLEAAAECIGQGRQALVLVPEVALTAGFLARVEARFGARPGEWHHGVTGAARRRLWLAAAEGSAKLVVGARSALFLPFRDLGLVVIDEEHDQSYKQEDMVLYNARDMAVLRAAQEEAVAVLASATPSLESWANAESGKYRRLDLPERFGAATLPQVETVDLRQHKLARDRWIAPPLEEAAKARLARGEQVLFFLNRRGYAPLTLCRGCGHQFFCPHCDARMVTHRLRREMLCHQCGHTAAPPRECPECGRDDRLAEAGPGVERIAEEAARLFPGARIALLSSDHAASPAEVKARLEAIAAGEADIVVGTQMAAKGHNFPLLTLVGVIDADLGLGGGDLRASERTFQLLHQVAGRAGRADKPGIAMIQTVNPDHAVIRAILAGDPEGFWQAEAEMRHHAGAPPYGRMAGVIVSGTDEAKTWEVARAFGQMAPVLARQGVELFGPAPAPVSRIRGRARVRLLLKCPKGVALQPAIAAWRAAVKVPSSVRVTVDIDPQSFM